MHPSDGACEHKLFVVCFHRKDAAFQGYSIVSAHDRAKRYVLMNGAEDGACEHKLFVVCFHLIVNVRMLSEKGSHKKKTCFQVFVVFVCPGSRSTL